MTTELVRYDEMCRAIAECERVDEAKDIRDKARALEVYWAQSRNTEAERQATNVRIRAEIRCGELLAVLDRAHGGDRKSDRSMSNARTLIDRSPYAETLEANGISRQAASRLQALAAVPSDVIDEALRDPGQKPSVKRILAAATVAEARDPTPKCDRDALWLWGRLREFEADGICNRARAELYAGMTPAMSADVRRLIPPVVLFLQAMENDDDHA